MSNPLARSIMGNNLKEKKFDNLRNKTHNNYKSSDYRSNNSEVNVDVNLTKLINDLIQGDTKVVDRSSVNKMITLEEAADRVKNGL